MEATRCKGVPHKFMKISANKNNATIFVAVTVLEIGSACH